MDRPRTGLPARRGCELTGTLTPNGRFVTICALLLAGCQQPRRPDRIKSEPIPLPEAARIVNENIARIGGTLRAAGAVDGYFTTEKGRRRSYHLEGVLFYRAPIFVRFELKKLGDTQLLFGSNQERYWCFIRQDDTFFCGSHDESDEPPPDLPARPDQLVDALGLTPVPVDSQGRSIQSGTHVTQRVAEDFQQVLFLTHGEPGRGTIGKEYWLDRFPPHLVRRVIFRGADGNIEMQSNLEDYRRMQPGGPLLPRVTTAEWPKLKARMRFEVRKWTPVYQIGPRDIQFATHPQCLETESIVPR